MHPSICRTALKEWAVAVGALDRGDQILLLRKGGIREEGREFRVAHPEFLLYPTYEHQREDLLQQRYHEDLRQVLSEPLAPDTVIFTLWARVEETIEVAEQERVDALSSYYIWTQDYSQKRLRWKPRHPLSVMLLRLYRLDHPARVPYIPEYGGCKSWVTLAQALPLGRLTPVLSDEDFRNKVGEIRDALESDPVNMRRT